VFWKALVRKQRKLEVKVAVSVGDGEQGGWGLGNRFEPDRIGCHGHQSMASPGAVGAWKTDDGGEGEKSAVWFFEVDCLENRVGVRKGPRP